MALNKEVVALREALESMTAALAFAERKYHGRILRIVELQKNLLDALGD